MLQFSNSAATVGAVGAVGAVIVFWRLRRRNECWIRVGTVDELCVYPLKGGKAKSVTSAEFGPRGMKAAVFKDRAFAVIRGDTNEFVSSTLYPEMTQLVMDYKEGLLVLQAPGREPLSIEEADLQYSPEKEVTVKMVEVHVKTITIGDKYDEFITDYLTSSGGLPFRLVYHWSDDAQRAARPKYMRLYPDSFLTTDIPYLAFATPFTLLSNASLKWLNKNLRDRGVTEETTMHWFRTNVMIQTDKMEEPFLEEQWQGKIRLGASTVLRFSKPCTRCPAVTVNPVTGVMRPDGEPLRTLKSVEHRLVKEASRRKVLGTSPIFAVNFSLQTPGDVQVGDGVFVLKEQ